MAVQNQMDLVQQEGVSVLIQLLTNTEDEELSKSLKYVLQTCVNIGK